MLNQEGWEDEINQINNNCIYFNIELVHLIITYDPLLVEPVVVAPALFYQYFSYDLNVPGRITLEIELNLVPPPYVPPIPAGDTVLAFISMDIVADDMCMDISTQLYFYEDPNTPYPDNLLMLENGTFIIPPELMLTSGEIYIYSPDYGDLNLNGYPFEVGDIVVFVSYFTGQIEFTAEQMANSDCNRDGIQATVADLVYMLRIVNGEPDTLLIAPPELPNADEVYHALARFNPLLVDEAFSDNAVFTIFVWTDEPLGGFALPIEFPDNVYHIGETVLGDDVTGLQLATGTVDNTVKVLGYSFNEYQLPEGAFELIRIPFEASGCVNVEDFNVDSADFSDKFGRKTDIEYEIRITHPAPDSNSIETTEPAMETPKAFPNPFNSAVTISFASSRPCFASVEIFNILGKKVATLINRFIQPGKYSVIWDGKTRSGEIVATGLYLCRIQLGSENCSIKLHYLK
ncbi:MAG: hypothetical protein DRP26_00820 [Candidatus Zixiibacteriota bacterium]|nr:MAG: hypothetical protein DRP26_00820 [candidate division Zixibacteria bacterium]